MDRNHRRTFAVGNERFAQLGSIGELVFHQSLMILLPYNASRSDVRPQRFERRARLVSAIARGRRWLDDVVSGRVTTIAELCAREKCSARQVNMTISLAFLAPNLVKAAVEGRLPRGIGVERLRDPPAEWSRQFEALGLNPECS
jgi:site-specific DNA recombinase